MSPSTDIGPAASGAAAGPDEIPQNWREALMALVAARVELVRLESKEAVGGFAKRAGFLTAAVGLVFFAWALLIAGGVALIAESTDWPWSWVALAAAVAHLLGAIIFAKLASPKVSPAFPVTRTEFQKDREWIENLHKPTKSSV